MTKHLFFIAFILTSATALAQSSIDDVLRSIKANNLELKALQHENEATVLDAKAENTIAGPSLEYSPFYAKDYNGIAESELIISEEINFPTKYAARNKRTRIIDNMAQKRYDSMQRDILLQAHLLCLDIIRVNQLIDIQTQRFNDCTKIQAISEKRLAAGDATLLDLNQSKIELMDAKKELSALAIERSQFVSQLTLLNGGISIDISDNRYPDFIIEADFESFLSRNVSNNPDVQSAEAGLNAARHDVSTSHQEWLPSIKMGYRRNTDKGEAVNGALLGVSFPLFNTASKVKAAKQREKAAEIQLYQTRQETEAALRSRYNELQSILPVLDHHDTELMMETVALYEKALEAGNINEPDYFTAVSNIYDKMLSHINLHCQAAKIHAELYSNSHYLLQQ